MLVTVAYTFPIAIVDCPRICIFFVWFKMVFDVVDSVAIWFEDWANGEKLLIEIIVVVH